MRTLGGYRIIRKIAESLDILYEAQDSTLGRRVALKELRLPDDLTPKQRKHAIERFFREARAAGALAHPNILQIYGAGEDEGRHFIAMEYLEGSTVRDILQNDGPLPPNEAVPIAVQIANALQYAHSRGVVHRDVKPDNIMVLPDGQVKLTDFGIAQIASDIETDDEPVVGTPSYMSPEQIRGEETDPRTDLFSLGATLYEMLTGRKPFAADDVPSITHRILSDEPDPAPEIPAALRAAIFRALAKQPQERFESAREFGIALLAAARPGADREAAAQTRTAAVSHVGPPPGPATPQAASGRSNHAIPHTSPSVPPRLGASVAEYLATHPRRKARGHLTIVAWALGLALLAVFAAYAAVSVSRGFRARAVVREAADHLHRGAELYKAGDYPAAVLEFQQAARLSPTGRIADVARENIIACYLGAGVAASRQGKSQEAIADYRIALTLDPANAAAHYNLGVEYFKLGQEDAALAEWQTAIEQGPGSPAGQAAAEMTAQVHLSRGDNLSRQGRIAEAVTQWQQAVNAAPKSQWGRLAQDNIRQAMGR